MNFWELVKTRRSVRKFDSTKPVTDEQVDKILEAGIWAPSAGNTQCWRFFVVRDANIKEELALRGGHQPFITDAPVLIVVCSDLNHIGQSYGARGRNIYSFQDTAAATQNMLLAATELGLASCWVGAFDEGKISGILKLEEGLRVDVMIPIGHSAEHTITPKRHPIDRVAKKI